MSNTALEETRTDRERLTDSYELRLKGEGNPLSGSLFAAYVLGLVGVIYGSVLMHYVVTQWPQLLTFVHDQPVLATAVPIVVCLLAILVAWRAGRARGPAVPEPGFIEMIVRTDLPRSLTLRNAWRGSVIVVVASCLGLGAAIPIGLTLANVTPAVIPVGIVLGLLTAAGILRGWLAGQVAGHGPVGTRRTSTLLDELPAQAILQQSLLSESVTMSLTAGDSRRARTQVFQLRLKHRPERVAVAGPRATLLRADFAGLRRTGAVSLAWTIAHIAAVAVGSLGVILHSRSPLVLPVFFLLAHLSASGLTRGHQAQADGAGQPSILGLPWQEQTVVHLAPLALLDLLVALAVGFASGAQPITAVSHAAALTLAVAGGQLLAAHKGSPPAALMGMSSGAGGGGSALWMMHPAIAVVIAAFAGYLGPTIAVAAGAVVVLIGWQRAASRYSPARLTESIFEQAQTQAQERAEAKAKAKKAKGG